MSKFYVPKLFHSICVDLFIFIYVLMKSSQECLKLLYIAFPAIPYFTYLYEIMLFVAFEGWMRTDEIQ